MTELKRRSCDGRLARCSGALELGCAKETPFEAASAEGGGEGGEGGEGGSEGGADDGGGQG